MILDIELAEQIPTELEERLLPRASASRGRKTRKPSGVLTRGAKYELLGPESVAVRIDRLPPFPRLAAIPTSQADCHTGC